MYVFYEMLDRHRVAPDPATSAATLARRHPAVIGAVDRARLEPWAPAPDARTCSPGTTSRSTASSSSAIDALDAGQSVLVAAPDRLGQDGRGRVRRRPGAGGRAAGLLHGADQGAVEPEVPRPGAAPRRRAGRPADRRQRHQRRRPGRGDDHRGAAQHDLRPVAARSTGSACVVLDEVHFLQDTYRGPVWEEVIIHLPARRAARVPLGHRVATPRSWPTGSTTVRGPTAAVIEERRPVAPREPVPRRRPDRPSGSTCCPTLVDGRPNPEADRLDGEAVRGWRRQRPPARPAPALHARGGVEVVERLDDEDMLPAIYFIFSRNACDEAAQACLDAGLRLTDRRRSATASGRSSTSASARIDDRRPRRARLRPLPRRSSRPASPPTTPGWCRRSRRRSRRASPRVW